MKTFLPDRLASLLQDYLHAPGWCVAFSGGLDSTVLLHLLCRYARKDGGPPLRAIHVHHGLQDAADDWPQHCTEVCAALDVPLQVIFVQVEQGASLEEAARAARYAAFAQSLQADEVLMLGQHQDDQVETLLLRLLRGAGVAGLQGMPQSRCEGRYLLLRPLLQISRRELEMYAARNGLRWVEDPSNQSDDYDRNFLRNRVLPLLQGRWPGLVRVLQRTAGHMQEAQQLLGELARQDLEPVQVVSRQAGLCLEGLCIDGVLQLSVIRQKNLLRHWLADKGRAVDAAHWQGWQDLLHASADAEPVWPLEKGALLRFRQQVFWLPDDWLQEPEPLSIRLTVAGEYLLPGNGRLLLAGELPKPLEVRYRQGGERMQLPGRGRRDLKRLLQEQGVAPFVRQRLPLLFRAGELVAIAGLPALRAEGWQALQIDWQAPALT